MFVIFTINLFYMSTNKVFAIITPTSTAFVCLIFNIRFPIFNPRIVT